MVDSAPLPPSSGFRATRLVLRTDAPVLAFAPLSPAAPSTYSGRSLPPSRCWSNPSHRSAPDGCRCGYHWFHRLDEALLFIEGDDSAFVGVLRSHSARFVEDSYTGWSGGSLRSPSGVYVGLLLPSCRCTRPSVGVASHFDKMSGPAQTDAALGWVPLVPACLRHCDKGASSLLGRWIATAPVSAPDLLRTNC